MTLEEALGFYRGRRVLVTGHTGFKGSWLCMMLAGAGAEVWGYALEPEGGEESLFALSGLEGRMRSVIGDVRDFGALSSLFTAVCPKVVFHLAAQPLVREGYLRPRETFETNVMGTVNVLECVRRAKFVETFLNVTTDKVYLNREWCWGYREEDSLDGYDPYSNSKSCSELATHSYAKSFLADMGIPASTARAGNVIGGGDFSRDRVVPDCVRAAISGEPVVLRNPESTRPYQHVLEPLSAYLMIAAAQHADPSLAGAYNVGPGDEGCATTRDLVSLFCREWGGGVGWEERHDAGPHEATFLKLDSSKVRARIGWEPTWTLGEAVSATVEWYKNWAGGGDAAACMEGQIERFAECVRGSSSKI